MRIAAPETSDLYIPTKRPFNFGRWFSRTGWRHLVGAIMVVFSTALDFGGWSEPDWRAALFVFLGALAAYSFSRMRFVGRRPGLLMLVLVQMFPQLLAVVAIFLLLNGISDIFPAIGLDSQVGLIMVYLGGALGVNTYLMYGFFNTVPASIDEAAKIDGAGHARIFFTIILRLVAPILAVVGLLSFVGTTNEFVIASIVLITPEKQTLAVGLYQFVSQEFSSNYSVFAAGAVLAALPVMALFLWLQKYIVGGLTAGSVK